MSVFKQKGSQFYRCQFMVDGKTYVRSTKTTSKKLALEIESQYREEVIRKVKLGVKDRILLTEAFRMYEEEKESIKSYHTIRIYIAWVKNYLKGYKYLDEVKSSDLERMCFARRREGKSEQVVRYGVIVFRGVHKLASKLGYQTPDVQFPEVKTSEERTRFLTGDEEQRLLDHLSGDLRDIVIALLDTGGRKGEITALKWDQIDFQNRRILIRRPKVDNESYVPMTKRLYAVLFKRFQKRESEMWVFPSPRNLKRPRNSLHKAFDAAVVEAKLEDVTLHTLRHTFASKLAQRGFSIQKIANLLGHSDVQTSMRYSHLVHDSLVDEARDLLDRAI